MQTIKLRTGARPTTSLGSTVRTGFAMVWKTLRTWARILHTRSALAEMDDRMLADLGISRAQADFQLSNAPWRLADRVARR